MSTQIQQTLQRLRLLAPSGEIYRPRQRLLAVLNVLAGAILGEAPEHGCTHSVGALARQSGKGERTVQTALREAEACGVIKIVEVWDPIRGQQASRYWIDKLLCDAAALSRPYSGPDIIYKAMEEAPAKQGGDTAARSLRATQQHKTTKELVMTTKTGVQFLHPDYRRSRPLAPPRGSAPAVLALAVQAVPLPLGGGGAGPALSEEDPLREDQLRFFQFFEDFEIVTDFQPRLVRGPKAGQRGAPLWRAAGGDVSLATGSATTALDRLLRMETWLAHSRGKKRLEGVVRPIGDHPFLLIDDLSHEQVNKLENWWYGSMMVIETSKSNHQAFLRAPGVLTHAERTSIQRQISSKFGGDLGAVNGSQLHRYPGSMNFKNGGSWCTKLTFDRYAETAGADQISKLEQEAGAPTTTPAIRPAAHQPVGTDPSRQAFGYACREIKRGADHEWIAAQIADLFNQNDKHTVGRDGGLGWGRRTVKNAALRVQG